MVDGCREAAGDRTYADLVAARDQGVIDVLRATGRLGSTRR
jgi:carnitine 3-dehydrogenase